MPTATSFTALGRGNGFPLCLEKVDVSGYDRWTTLGGVSKESPSPTDAKISTSLVNAMKLYWNLYSLKGTCSVSGTDADGVTISSSVDEVVADFKDHDGVKHSKPNERVCITGVPGTEDFELDFKSSLGGQFQADAQLVIGIDFEFMRFYNGETTDENNFIGYGLESFLGDPDRSDAVSGNDSFMNFTASARYTDEDDVIGNSAGAYDCIGSVVEEEDTDWTYSYATISGITFVRATFDYFQGSSPEPTKEATIDSIDFYTY
tara:strand:- start:968 stop:1753 length:786 start_codon:yes stop_codon:yes gene_type:complete